VNNKSNHQENPDPLSKTVYTESFRSAGQTPLEIAIYCRGRTSFLQNKKLGRGSGDG